MSGLQVPHSHWRRCSIGWRRFTWLGYRFPIVTGGAAEGGGGRERPKGSQGLNLYMCLVLRVRVWARVFGLGS